MPATGGYGPKWRPVGRPTGEIAAKRARERERGEGEREGEKKGEKEEKVRWTPAARSKKGGGEGKQRSEASSFSKSLSQPTDCGGRGVRGVRR